MKNLTLKAWLALAALAVVMGLLLFIPAGTTRYWQAWVYLAIFTGASALTTLYLARHDRALLERRMSRGADRRETAHSEAHHVVHVGRLRRPASRAGTGPPL